MRALKQFNNITEPVMDDLRQVLSSGNSQISITAASFSIYAYEVLKEELEKVDCVNFIFTSPTFYTDKSERQKREFYIPKLNRERSLWGSDLNQILSLNIQTENEYKFKKANIEVIENLKKQISFLESKARKEVRYRKKFELHKKILALQNELDALSSCDIN